MSFQISFEVFAPKTVPAAFGLARTMRQLALLSPEFTSVTCGTGGGAVSQTVDTVAALHDQSIGAIGAHMTCAGIAPEVLLRQTRDYAKNGVKAIVALRGDNEVNPNRPAAKPEKLMVLDLINLVKCNTKMGVYVAAYPEVHPKAASAQADLDALRQKQDAGADAAITQFFFDAEVFLRFRDKAAKAGITLPLIPGILPVQNWTRTEKIAAQCNTQIPADIAEGFARAEREDRMALMATAHTTEMCDALLTEGVDHLHFYTLNQAQIVTNVCKALGRHEKQNLRQVA